MGFTARLKETARYYLSVPLVFLGFGFDRAWLASLFYYEAFPGLVISDFHLFMASLGAASLVCAIWARKHASLCASRFAQIFSMAAMVLGSACIVVACFFIGSPVLKVVGVIAAGLGSGVLYLMWADVYGRMSPMSVITYFSLGVLAGEAIKIFFLGLPAFYLAIFAVILPLLSVPCVVASFKKLATPQRETSYPLPQLKTYPWKPVLLISMFFFIFSYDGNQMDMQNMGFALGVIVIAVLMLTVVSPRARLFKIESFNQILFPMLVVCLALILPSSSHFVEINSFRYDAGATTAFMLIMVVLSSIAWRYNVNPVWLGGIQRALRSVIELLGWGTASLVASFHSEALTSTMPFVFEMVALGTILAAFFTEKGLSAEWEYPFSDGTTEALPQKRLHQRLVEMAQHHGLSARESDVLELLALDQPIDTIAEQLFIAPGTVKTHIHRIYQKLGVKNRTELLEFIADPSKS